MQAQAAIVRPRPLGTVTAVTAGLAMLTTGGTALAQALEEIVVTAQKREVGLQDAPLSISAFSGETLEKGRILDAGDLAYANAGLTFTNPTPFDMELNIRGVMNTRLDAPSASRSVGTFMDEVVVGRMGLMNMNFYDIERIEVLRGPAPSTSSPPSRSSRPRASSRARWVTWTRVSSTAM
jgi:iron complex outermembrane receptor protein